MNVSPDTSANIMAASTPPNSTGTTPGRSGKKVLFQGPCYVKMLVSNLVAGSIIGKNGAVITHIEATTQAAMKLSPTNTFFPGTSDRIVVMGGTLDQINEAMAIILEKINEVVTVQDTVDDPRGGPLSSELSCKLAVPKSAVSGIIGKGGQQIKQLQESTGAKVQISNRYGDFGINERIITISGSLHNMHRAALQIATTIQEDPNLKEYMFVIYPPTNVPNNSPYGPMYPSGGGLGNMNSPAFGGGYSSPTHDQILTEMCEVHIELPDAMVGAVVGKSGMYLAEIMRSTGAAIKLSQKGDYIPGTQNRRVTISGTMGAVHRAHIRLMVRLRESATPRQQSGGYSSPTHQQQMHHAMSPGVSNPQHGGSAGPYNQFSGAMHGGAHVLPAYGHY